MSGAYTGVLSVLAPLADGSGCRGFWTGKELSHPPSDGVSSLCFSRHSDRLLVSSWDKTVGLYDAEANVPMGVFMHAAPVLDCCFHDDSSGFSAGSDQTVRRYAFKCHRLTEDGKDIVYPVNAISFHPIYGTFATGGCDRFVNVWDGANKRRLFQYPRYQSSIAALSFSRDGTLLAVASSYTYEEGDIPHESDSIFIRDVNEVEVKPRPKTFPAPPQ